jgi:hypothetical protein
MIDLHPRNGDSICSRSATPGEQNDGAGFAQAARISLLPAEEDFPSEDRGPIVKRENGVAVQLLRRCHRAMGRAAVDRIRIDSNPNGARSPDLYLNERIFLANIPREIWRYELGGYPILKKWLGYRQANRRTSAALSLLELDNLRTIVLRIAALLVVRPLLDVAYSKTILAAHRRLGHPME